MAIIPKQQVARARSGNGGHHGSMGKDPASGKATIPMSASGEAPMRRVHGPRSLAALLPPITRPAFRSRSPAATQLMTDWPSLVGPALAARAHPKRFAGGTLFLAVSGPAALELQHQTTQLIARINAGLGRQIVERVRFVQEDVADAALAPAPRPPAPRPIPVAGLPEGDLHDALARLGARIAARSRS